MPIKVFTSFEVVRWAYENLNQLFTLSKSTIETLETCSNSRIGTKMWAPFQKTELDSCECSYRLCYKKNMKNTYCYMKKTSNELQ